MGNAYFKQAIVGFLLPHYGTDLDGLLHAAKQIFEWTGGPADEEIDDEDVLPA